MNGTVREATITTHEHRVRHRGAEYVPRTSQPEIWVPSGRPCLACIDSALDRVVIKARIMRPIYRVCQKNADEDSLLHEPERQ